MHPNAFLKTLWRTEVIDQVVVAMSFEERFKARFEEVVRPAIEGEPFGRITLKAYGVDNSKTGDSILSDIVNGIAHPRLVLADVSVIDEGCIRSVAENAETEGMFFALTPFGFALAEYVKRN